VCSNGDFPIASGGGNGHQALGAKLCALKQTTTFLAIIFYFYFFPFMQITHYCWISQIGKISPKEKTLFGRSQCDKQINKQIS